MHKLEQMLSSSTSPISNIDNMSGSRQQKLPQEHSTSQIPISFDVFQTSNSNGSQSLLYQMIQQAQLQQLLNNPVLQNISGSQSSRSTQNSLNNHQNIGSNAMNFNNPISTMNVSFPPQNSSNFQIQPTLNAQFHPQTFQMFNQTSLGQFQQPTPSNNTQNLLNIGIPSIQNPKPFSEQNLQQIEIQTSQILQQFIKKEQPLQTKQEDILGHLQDTIKQNYSAQQNSEKIKIEKLNDYSLFIQPQTNNLKKAACLKHIYKQDSILQFVCCTSGCSDQFYLLCPHCVREHSGNHEIIEVQTLVQKTKPKIISMIENASDQKNTIELQFNQNIEGLKSIQSHITELLESVQSLQRGFSHLTDSINNDCSLMYSTLKELDSGNVFQDEEAFRDNFKTINRISADIQSSKCEGLQQLLIANSTISNFIHNMKADISKIKESATDLQENLSKQSIGSEMIEQEKKHQEDKTLDHFSKLFHLIKGHAKKRDVINFLTWEQFTKELKYSKDIKDKHGEHFYVSFSLRLKNIENMEIKDINESFINKVVSVVEDKAPEIQNKKNVERKKIDPNGKKRKYCRFNPRIEIDVTLDASAYKNIKIE